MIQRIQTIYLLLASALVASMLFFPLGVYHLEGNNDIVFRASGIANETSTNTFNLELFKFIIVPIAAWVFSTIFYFKKRNVQMRLSITAIILNSILFGMGLFYWFKFSSLAPHISSMIYPPLFFPLFAIVLLILAYKAIKKDDDLVKSVDRIR